MVIRINDFGLEWGHEDHIIHKANYEDLIKAYEKELKENKIVDMFVEKLKQEYSEINNIPRLEKELVYEMANKVAKQLAKIERSVRFE